MNKDNKVIKKKIMVAEDDPGIVEVIKLMLEMEGYEVTVSIDGEAIKDMKNEMPDLLLLDIWMAGMDGKEICRHLKNSKKTKNIPIVMISATKDIEKSAIDAGADDFLPKPFEMDDLLDIVKKYTK